MPPIPGGLSDHTAVLAPALAEQGADVTVLAVRGDPSRLPVRAELIAGDHDLPRAAQRLGLTTVIIQYVPFAFARRGVAPALVLAARQMKAAGTSIVLMLHEPYVPFTRLIWLVTGPLQRLQLRLLVRAAACVFTPVPRFAEIARGYGATSVVVAPVGATLPVSGLDRSAARARLGIGLERVAIGVFSPAASGFAHDWIARATTGLNGCPGVTWVLFGFGSDRTLTGYPVGPNVITVGTADAVTIADTMRALDVLAAPYEDGLTLRRTGALLGLASGVATVSSTGPLFDPVMHALAACEPNREAFAKRLHALVEDPVARVALATRTGRYRELASTEALARKLIAEMRM